MVTSNDLRSSLPGRGVAAPKAVGTPPLPLANVMQGPEDIGGPSFNPSKWMEQQTDEQMAPERAETKPTSPEDTPEDDELVRYAQQAEQQSRTYQDQTVRSSWQRAYKATRNEHFSGSKYLSSEWRNRSKVFKPKTRVAMRKAMATAASALFSTTDRVSIKAGNDADPKQRASAAIKQELINYRLGRQSTKASVPWFLVSMGAMQDTYHTGICVSKQCWLHKTRPGTKTVHTTFGNGTKMSRDVDTDIVEIDRPEILLYPPENVRVSPLAHWSNPAQHSPFLQLITPMTVDDVCDMLSQDQYTKGSVEWRDLSREQIESAATAMASETESVRRAREGGRDRYTENGGTGGWKTVWVVENFLRVRGIDWHFYTLGTTLMASDAKPVWEVYPEQKGDRPVVYGYGQIEAHRINPIAAAEAIQPLQQEINDVTNLRLDQLKQVVLPVAKVKRGGDVDVDVLKKRSPNTTVYMRETTDLEWDRPPDVPPSAYQETNFLNVDIDDLTGSFSGSSVQTNRSLNETVGGMNLLNAGANSTTEFDLRVWVETWVEPVIAQIVKLEEFYESDTVVLSMAGQRAQLMKRFGVNKIDDELLAMECETRVDVGVGASDPMQRLSKFKIASETAFPILGPDVQAGKIEIQAEEILNEVFGAAGYSDAGERFVHILTDQEMQQKQQGQQGDPAAMAKVQADAQAKQAQQQDQTQFQAAQLQWEKDKAAQEWKHEMELASLKAANALEIAVEVAKITAGAKLAGGLVDHAAGQETAQLDHQRQLQLNEQGQQHALAQNDQKGIHSLMLGHQKGQQATSQLDQKGAQASQQLDLKGQQAMQQADMKGQQQAALADQSGQHQLKVADLKGRQQASLTSMKPPAPKANGKMAPKPKMLPMPTAQDVMGAPAAPSAPTPSASASSPGQMMNGIMAMIQEQNQGMQSIFQQLSKLDGLDSLQQAMSAPRQIARGPDGKVAGFHSPLGFHPAQRDPATGQIIGVGAPTQQDPNAPPQPGQPPSPEAPVT